MKHVNWQEDNIGMTTPVQRGKWAEETWKSRSLVVILAHGLLSPLQLHNITALPFETPPLTSVEKPRKLPQSPQPQYRNLIPKNRKKSKTYIKCVCFTLFFILCTVCFILFSILFKIHLFCFLKNKIIY